MAAFIAGACGRGVQQETKLVQIFHSAQNCDYRPGLRGALRLCTSLS